MGWEWRPIDPPDERDEDQEEEDFFEDAEEALQKYKDQKGE